MNALRRHWDIGLFLLLTSVFVAAPQIDLAFSGLFYRPDSGFFLRDQPWVVFVHKAIPLVARWLGAALGSIVLLSLLPRFGLLAGLRLPALFLLLSFCLGPGLLVNGVLKEHWGRARPADVQEFGGDKKFTPAFAIADQCRRNCSFVSGHAAQGFFFALLGFLFRRNNGFVPGLALGGVVCFARIVQGRHFLSDVVFALFAVYFVGKLLRNLMFDPVAIRPQAGTITLRPGLRKLFRPGGIPRGLAASLASGEANQRLR